ncbi:3',5'-cyclic AMP phosphodiesterase CpdA [Agrobacterium vitis]|nr:3',5'-cyclic AMP phosphodiesterase CpdA [Agrobacterium vitis]MBE1438837.1 3',5'-cyclic AMP phosphodiesterase CpdA [Agrobacterium vitis]
MRIFVGSDFHVDHRENLLWFEQLSRDDYRQDILLVVGDVANDIPLFSHVMSLLSERFFKVLYVPGNHDLWIRSSGTESSFDKLEAVKALCSELDIGMEPYAKGDTLIVPLAGWYDYSFGAPGQMLRNAWMDYRRCDWEGRSDAEVSALFDETNIMPDTTGYKSIISFSHFLPRIDLMPARMPEKYHFLYPVLGSSRLEARIRALGSSMHFYGHSHLNRRVVKDGVTYINNAFGYPSEKDIAARMLMYIGEM